MNKSLSFSIATIIVFIFSYSINIHYLPSIHNKISIIINSLLAFSILPFGIILYLLLFKKLNLLLDNKIIKTIPILLAIIIIFSFFLIEINTKQSTLLPENNLSINNPPNIIIISIDALRADHLSCYGYKHIKTKNIDKIAEDGFLFRNAYSTTSWTLASMMSMLTGKYPSVHQCTNYVKSKPESIITITQVLKSYGYQTYGINTSEMLNYRYGFSSGFDRYIEYREISWLYLFKETRIYKFLNKILSQDPHKYSTMWATKEIKKFLNKKHNSPFFLWTHYLDPHAPYTPPKKYIPDGIESAKESYDFMKTKMNFPLEIQYSKENRSSLINLYDGEILYIDDKIGEIMQLLKNKNLYDNSFILLTSDHGEEFLEHNGWRHGRTLYNEVVNIPFIVKLPIEYNQEKMPHTINKPISLSSLPGTLLNILKIDKYKELGNENIFIMNEDISNVRVFSEVLPDYPPLKKMVTHSSTIIYDRETNKIELYNISNDIYEKNDISDEYPEKTKQLLKELLIWVDKNENERNKHKSSSQLSLDEESLEGIRGLGYIE
jgi:arylsulfatase